MISTLTRYLYHMRKPRVKSAVNQAYQAYQMEMRKTRKALHLQNVQYLNKIENDYLQSHKQQIKRQHFDYQCSFRKQIFTDAYRLQQNQIKWNKSDEVYNANLNQHLHQEDIRKINRSRILKIMEHQSTDYWFNSSNVDQRMKEQTIFPQYIASSQYYYQLFSQALAYQLGNFHQLHLVSSKEQIIREKNKYLIPIYLSMREKITQFKKQQTNAADGERDLLKERIKHLISILTSWKQYTNILAMTSSQIMKGRIDLKNESTIKRKQKEVLKSLTSKMNSTFIDSIQEDTQEFQISFDEYLVKINKDKNDSDMPASGNTTIQELDLLLSKAQSSTQNSQENLLVQNQSEEEDSEEVVQEKSVFQPLKFDSQQINPLFLNQKETTTSVQILKEQFRQDQEMQVLLNQLGEIDVRYPKLLERVWQSIN